MTAAAWIKNSGLFQSASFNRIVSVFLLTSMARQTAVQAQLERWCIKPVIGKGSEGGWKFLKLFC